MLVLTAVVEISRPRLKSMARSRHFGVRRQSEPRAPDAFTILCILPAQRRQRRHRVYRSTWASTTMKSRRANINARMHIARKEPRSRQRVKAWGPGCLSLGSASADSPRDKPRTHSLPASLIVAQTTSRSNQSITTSAFARLPYHCQFILFFSLLVNYVFISY